MLERIHIPGIHPGSQILVTAPICNWRRLWEVSKYLSITNTILSHKACYGLKAWNQLSQSQKSVPLSLIKLKFCIHFYCCDLFSTRRGIWDNTCQKGQSGIAQRTIYCCTERVLNKHDVVQRDQQQSILSPREMYCCTERPKLAWTLVNGENGMEGDS